MEKEERGGGKGEMGEERDGVGACVVGLEDSWSPKPVLRLELEECRSVRDDVDDAEDEEEAPRECEAVDRNGWVQGRTKDCE